MGKRKVALFMAAILTVTSVYPGGAVFAEDAVATETTLETASDEAPADAEIADPAKDQTAAPEEELADDPAGQTADDAEAELVDDETMTPVDGENADSADSEDTTEEQAVDPEPALSDTIKADGELAIDLSDATQAVPVAAEAGDKTIQSVKLDGLCAEGYTEYAYDDLNDLDMTINFAGEYSEPEYFSYWSPSLESIADGQYTVLKAESGSDTAWLVFYKGTEIISIPQRDLSLMGYDPFTPGDYTLKLYYNGNLYDPESLPEGGKKEWDITINIPYTEELNTEMTGVFTVGPNDSAWFKLSDLGAPNSYVINIVVDEDSYVYPILFENRDGIWTRQKFEEFCGSESFPVEVEEGVEYYIAVQSLSHSPSGTISLSQKEDAESAELIVDGGPYDVYRYHDLQALSESINVTVYYGDDSWDEIQGWQWKLYTDEDKSYLGATTANGNRVKLTCYQGTDQLNWPANDEGIRPGSYTIKLQVDGKSYADEEKNIKIELPKCNQENCLEVGSIGKYDIEDDAYEWFIFEPETSEDPAPEYVIQHDDTEGDSCSYIDVYKFNEEENLLSQDNNIMDNSASYSFVPEAGCKYYIAVYSDWGHVTGNITVKKKASIARAELTGIEEGDTIDPYDIFGKLSSLTAKIFYVGSDGEPEEICNWERSWNDEWLEQTTKNGDTAKLTLCWRETEETIGIPDTEDRDGLPIGAGFFVKLTVGNCEKDSKEFKIGISYEEQLELLTSETSPTAYTLAPNAHKWYSFKPTLGEGEKETYVLNIDNEESGETSLFLYQQQEEGIGQAAPAGPEYLNYIGNTSDSALSFNAEADTTYYIVLINHTTQWDEDEDEIPIETSGTICVKKQLSIADNNSVTLGNLPEGCIDVYDPVKAISQVKATVTYSDGSTETVSDWEDYSEYYVWYYDEGWNYDEWGQALTTVTRNGNKLYLTLWDASGKIANAFWEDDDGAVCTGKYTLKLFDGNEYPTDSVESGEMIKEKASAEIEIGIPEAVDSLTPGTAQTYELQPGTIKWYKLSAAAGEYIYKNEYDTGDIDTYIYRGLGSDALTRESLYSNTTTISLGGDQGCWLVIYAEDYLSEPVKGTISLTKKQELKSASLDVESSIDTFDAYTKLSAATAELTYDDDSATINKWKESQVYIGNEDNWVWVLAPATEIASEIYLTLWKNQSIIDMPRDPINNGRAAQELLNDDFVLKLVTLENGYINELGSNAQKDVEIGPPQGATELTPGDTLKYELYPGEHMWYQFDASDAAEYAIQAGEANDGTSIHVYTEKSDGMLHEQTGDYANVYSFVPESNKAYWIVLLGQDESSCSGEISIVKKKTINSIGFEDTEGRITCDVTEVMDYLRDIKVTLSYENEETMIITEWQDYKCNVPNQQDWQQDPGVLYHRTESGDEICLTLWQGDTVVSLPVYDTANNLTAGTYTLKLLVNGIIKDTPVKTVTLKEMKTEQIPLDQDLNLGNGEKKQFSIEAQGENKILGIKPQNGYVLTTLYEVTEEGAKEVTLIGIYSGEYRYLLTAGKDYRLLVENNTGDDMTLRFTMENQLAIQSVTGFAFDKTTFSTLDAIDAIGSVASSLSITYQGGTSEKTYGWNRSWTTIYSEENGYSSSYVIKCSPEPKNGNNLEIRILKDGEYYSIPESKILEIGTYTVELYVDGKAWAGCKETIKVIEGDMTSAEAVKPDTSYKADLKKGENKWYRFTAPETGEYTMYTSGGDDRAEISLYNSSGQRCNVYSGYWYYGQYLLYPMTAGETYYYKVCEESNQAGTFTLTLTKKKKPIALKVTKELSKKQFQQNRASDLQEAVFEMMVELKYEGGLPQELSALSSDQFDNYVTCRLYKKNGEIVDRDHEINIYSALELGEYQLVIKVLDASGEAYEGLEWTEEIEVVASECKEHQFKQVRKEATCTENGYVKYECSLCGWVDSSRTETLFAPGHDWGEWKNYPATVLASARDERECRRCHLKDTKNIGSKLPAKLTVPATKANMKTGQSTSAFSVGMAAGDSIVSVTSSNTKLMKVTSINKTGGTFKLKAGKKTGKVKITIKLASGQTKVITLTVQKKKVTTKKVKVTKKLTLKKGAKYTLKPVVTPITTQDKIKFKSSNKKIATVTGKGVIKAKKPGKVTITVTCGKKKASCKITVKK